MAIHSYPTPPLPFPYILSYSLLVFFSVTFCNFFSIYVVVVVVVAIVYIRRKKFHWISVYKWQRKLLVCRLCQTAFKNWRGCCSSCCCIASGSVGMRVFVKSLLKNKFFSIKKNFFFVFIKIYKYCRDCNCKCIWN